MSGFVLQNSQKGTPEILAAQQVAMVDDLPMFWSDVDDLDEGVAALTRGVIPIGSVEFLRACMTALDVPEPEPLDYPEALRRFFGREIRQAPLLEARDDEWVKPVQTKAFDAAPAGTVRQKGRVSPDEPVWISEPSSWRTEHRVYVRDRQILGVAQYDQGDHDEPIAASGEMEAIHRMIREWPGQPGAYALDVGRRPNGGLDLIEVNDAWGTGRYSRGITSRNFVRWLSTRWHEIAGLG